MFAKDYIARFLVSKYLEVFIIYLVRNPSNTDSDICSNYKKSFQIIAENAEKLHIISRGG